MLLATLAGSAQVIEFESGGLKYQTLTRNSVTVMFAHLPARVHEYAIIQVAVSNGAQAPVIIRPEDVTFERSDGAVFFSTEGKPLGAGRVVMRNSSGEFSFNPEEGEAAGKRF